jgi:hypothetical protein
MAMEENVKMIPEASPEKIWKGWQGVWVRRKRVLKRRRLAEM